MPSSAFLKKLLNCDIIIKYKKFNPKNIQYNYHGQRMEPDETPVLYTIWKTWYNTSYNSISVHSSCLCRVPGELTNTYQKCKLPQFPIQCATYLDINTFFLTIKNEQVIRKIRYRGMGGGPCLEYDPPTSNGFFLDFFYFYPKMLVDK